MSDARSQIVALGGDGFLDPSARPLEAFAFGLTGRPQPKVCLIPTASGDASAYIAAFYKAFGHQGRCSHLSLFRRECGDLRSFVLEHDVLYIGGGNTANLLAVWRVHGLDLAIREAWERGIVLLGASAGACALFEAGVSASFGEVAPLLDGIGLLAGGFCPHYEQRRETLIEMVRDGLRCGFGADDRTALHFVGNELSRAVGLDPERGGFQVAPGPVEIPVEVQPVSAGAAGSHSAR